MRVLSLSATLLVVATLSSAHTCMAAGSEAGARLGRLFTSESERRALDRPPPPPRPAKVQPRMIEIRLDGIVRREDGRHTIWLNGEARRDVPDLDRHSADRIKVRTASGTVQEVLVGNSFVDEARAWGFE